jgi:transcriptional regulator with XRE-family HTH domain
MKRFGAKLRVLRERHGMTQWDLADRLGFSQAYVYKLETGRSKPNVDLVVKLSKLFTVSTDVLVHDDLALDEGEQE